MQHISRQEIFNRLTAHGLLPLFNPDDLEICKRVVEAAHAGGARIFECTNRSAKALDIFTQLVPWVNAQFPDVTLGAGTIMDATAARQFYDAGAQFMVSPVVSADLAKFCNDHDTFWCPGATTLNEIVNAQHMGADIVKIFPANFTGGPDFVRAIKAPCPWLRLMPTGGVDGSDENLRDWFNAGVLAVGIGSQLFKKDIMKSGDYTAITTKTRQILTTIREIKGAKA